MNVADPVVDKEDLAAAVQLPEHRLPGQLVAILAHEGPHRLPALRRRLDHTHVPYAGQRHVERPRDGRGRQRQHVDLPPKLLEPLLVRYPEALLIVDDQQAQVLERHVLLHQPVRADDDVDDPRAQPLHHLPGLGVRAEAAQHLNPDGKGAQPLREGGVVLLGQDGRGAEKGHLLAVLHGLEGGPQRDLRLAVAHVAAHQPVQRVGLLHPRLHLHYRVVLVGRLHVGEGVLQLLLPRRVLREREALQHPPRRVEAQKLLGHLPGRPAGPRLGPHPLLRPQPRHAGLLLPRRHVRRQPVQVLRRDVEPVSLRVLQRQVLLLPLLRRHPSSPHEAADAVVDVDHVAPRTQVRVECLAPGRPAAHRTPPLGLPEDLGVGHHDKVPVRKRQREALRQRPGHQGERPRRRRPVQAVRDRSADIMFTQKLRHALRIVGEEHYPRPIAPKLLHTVGESVNPAPVGWRRIRAKPRPLPRRAHPLQVQLAVPRRHPTPHLLPGPVRRREAGGQLPPRLLGAAQRRLLLFQLRRCPLDLLGLIQGHHGVPAQEVQQGALVEEPGIERAALHHGARGQRLQLPGDAVQVAVSSGRPAAPGHPRSQDIRAGPVSEKREHLPGGNDLQSVHQLLGALRGRIEEPDALDGVAQQLDARWPCLVRGGRRPGCRRDG